MHLSNKVNAWIAGLVGIRLLKMLAMRSTKPKYKPKGNKMKISKGMLENWIGGDNMKVDDLLDLLLDVINGGYPVELFREEVLEYNEE